jgi:hypothetical protein
MVVITEATCAPENSLLLIMDPSAKEIPHNIKGELVAATASCVAVGTLSQSDGETSILLTDEEFAAKADGELQLVYDGSLLTPTLEISIRTVLGRSIVKCVLKPT